MHLDRVSRRWRKVWRSWTRSDPARLVRRVAIATAGAVLVVAGAALVFLPGPGLVVLAAGLAVLSVEFVWARRLLKRARAETKAGEKKLRRWGRRRFG